MNRLLQLAIAFLHALAMLPPWVSRVPSRGFVVLAAEDNCSFGWEGGGDRCRAYYESGADAGACRQPGAMNPCSSPKTGI